MTVVGLGSLSGGDDAVGIAVIAALREAGAGADLLAIRDASALIDLLAAGDRVVLVDAVVGLGPPGTVSVLAEADLDGAAKPVSTHALSVPGAVSLARTLYGAVPRLDLVGVTIDLPRGPQLELSPAVAAAIPAAVAAVRRLIAQEPDHA